MSAAIASVLSGASRFAVVCADWREVLGDGFVADHVFTDPPYDSRTHRNAVCISASAIVAGESKKGVAFGSETGFDKIAGALVGMARRWAVAFCAVESIGEYAAGAGDAWVRAGIWDKVAPSPQLTGDRPGQAVEAIAIMHRRGQRTRWNRGGGAGIWRCVAERGDERPKHPTPKPLRLMCSLVEDFTDPGDVVVDPYAGSGTTGVACLRLGRRVVLVERDPEYAALAASRMEAEAAGLSLEAARSGQLPMFGGEQA